MLGRLSHTRLLRYAGLFTWALVGVPLAYAALLGGVVDDPALPPDMSWHGWVAYAVFGLDYLWLTRLMDGHRARAADYGLLLVLTGSAIAISFYSLSGMGSILLMVVACVLPWLLPVWIAASWMVVSQFLVAPVYVLGQGYGWTEAILQSLLQGGFCAFIFVTSLVARQQAQARDDQRRLNAELRATRALLAESARVNERTRISRELHDLLGHHLTALSLNLEVAGHLAQGKAQEHVSQAHTLARLLLSDVREAVSQLRAEGAIDMRASLSPLAENVPGLDVAIDMPTPFLLDDPERAHVLLRCTQEIITNTVRHARASTLRLEYTLQGGEVRLQARDDGQGSEQVHAGNGLRGLRERLALYGGDVSLGTAPGAGFAIGIRLPLGGAGATVRSLQAGTVPAVAPASAARDAALPQRPSSGAIPMPTEAT